MDANPRNLDDIFSNTKKHKYRVPAYQRSYTWDKKQWNQLINDIEENDKHFLGPIILIKPEKDDEPFEIVDGQQRFTTLSLLYLALHKRFGELLSKENDKDSLEMDDYRFDRTKIRQVLVSGNEINTIKLKLSAQDQNYEVYQLLINKHLFRKGPGSDGRKRISKAFAHFVNELNNSIKDLEQARKLYEKLNECELILIVVTSQSDAYRLFDTLNNRGKPLTAMDIIKNKLLAKIEDKHGAEKAETGNSMWIEIVERLGHERFQERFVRHYYNVYKRVKNKPFMTKGKLIETYEVTIKNKDNIKDDEATVLLKSLDDKSKLYARLTNPKETNTELKNALKLLSRLGTAPAYAFLLFLFDDTKTNTCEDEQIMAAKFLVKFFVRRHLTNKPATKSLDKIFSENLIDDVQTFKQDNDGEKLSEKQLLDFISGYGERFAPAKLEDFKKELSGNIYDNNTDIARFVLAHLDEEHQHDERIHDFWVLVKKDSMSEKNKMKWSIEHILPQDEKLPYGWKEMLQDGGSDDLEKTHRDVVDTLGNLTLTAYNQKYSNYSFKTKKNMKEKGIDIGLNKALWLNEDLFKTDVWNATTIKKRTIRLVDEAVKLYSFEGEVIEKT